MKIKIVESISRYNKGVNEKIRKGTLEKPLVEMVMTPETFSKVFSPERIKLLQRINRNKIKSIYSLAKELGKPYEVVFRNIRYLEGMGLIRVDSKDNRKIPSISSKFSIDMLSDGVVA